MTSARAASIVAIAVRGSAALPTANATVLKNSQLRVKIDDHARIMAIVNKLWPSVNLIGKPADGFWRLNLQKGAEVWRISCGPSKRFTKSKKNRRHGGHQDLAGSYARRKAPHPSDIPDDAAC